MSTQRTHRYYTKTQLSSVLNSLEAYLGQHPSQRGRPDAKIDNGRTVGTNGGLHFVIVVDHPERTFNASTRRPLRFHLSEENRASVSSVAVVPQWGAFISLDDVDVSLTNMGAVLVNAIRSFVGIPVRRSGSLTSDGVLFEPSAINGEVAKWEVC